MDKSILQIFLEHVKQGNLSAELMITQLFMIMIKHIRTYSTKPHKYLQLHRLTDMLRFDTLEGEDRLKNDSLLQDLLAATENNQEINILSHQQIELTLDHPRYHFSYLKPLLLGYYYSHQNELHDPNDQLDSMEIETKEESLAGYYEEYIEVYDSAHGMYKYVMCLLENLDISDLNQIYHNRSQLSSKEIKEKKKSIDQALDLLIRAQNLSHNDASVVLQSILFIRDRENYMDQNLPDSAEYLLKAIERTKKASKNTGNKLAYLNIASHYWHLSTSVTNPDKYLGLSIDYYNKALYLGSSVACLELAKMYLRQALNEPTETHVTTILSKVLSYLKRAIEMGNYNAISYLVNLHVESLTKDNWQIDLTKYELLQYIYQGVQANHSTSIYLLGKFYFEGKVLKMDREQGIKLYEQAARMNNKDAIDALVIIYLTRGSVYYSKEVATGYLDLGAKLGSANCLSIQYALEKNHFEKLTTDQAERDIIKDRCLNYIYDLARQKFSFAILEVIRIEYLGLFYVKPNLHNVRLYLRKYREIARKTEPLNSSRQSQKLIIQDTEFAMNDLATTDEFISMYERYVKEIDDITILIRSGQKINTSNGILSTPEAYDHLHVDDLLILHHQEPQNHFAIKSLSYQYYHLMMQYHEFHQECYEWTKKYEEFDPNNDASYSPHSDYNSRKIYYDIQMDLFSKLSQNNNSLISNLPQYLFYDELPNVLKENQE